jgi:hypothetical protein
MAKRPIFTSDQLQIGGNHLLYEVQMLCNTAALLEDDSRWTHGWENKTQYMAVLESFLMHARSLMYFLCPPTGYKRSKLKERELFAVDFCRVGWSVKRWKDFNKERDAISADLMHLSIDRLEVGRNWEYTRLLGELKTMLLAFVDDADERLSAHVKSEIRAAFSGKRIAQADTASRPLLTSPLPGSSVPTTSLMAFTPTEAAETRGHS